MKTFEQYLEEHGYILQEKKEKWISKAVKHPGRCAEPGSKDCPEGSPQYNLAMRFKKGGDIYKAKQKKKKK